MHTYWAPWLLAMPLSSLKHSATVLRHHAETPNMTSNLVHNKIKTLTGKHLSQDRRFHNPDDPIDPPLSSPLPQRMTFSPFVRITSSISPHRALSAGHKIVSSCCPFRRAAAVRCTSATKDSSPAWVPEATQVHRSCRAATRNTSRQNADQNLTHCGNQMVCRQTLWMH